MRRRCTQLGVVLLLLWALPAAVRAGWVFEESADEAVVAAFAERQADRGIIYLREWTSVEAVRDKRLGGLTGRQVSLVEYLIADKARLEEAARILTYDSASMALRSVLVTVTRGARSFQYDSGDFTWTRITAQSDGIVYLDRTLSQGFIPDLRVGDRIRVEQEHQLVGAFGLTPTRLGQPDTPCFQMGLTVRVPASYQLECGLAGNPEGRRRVTTSRQTDAKWSSATWIVQADPDGTLPRCGDEYPSAEVTPYVARIGKWDGSDVAVGADWAAIGRACLARYEGVFAADENLGAEAAALVADAATVPEKIDRLYRHVQSTCHYLGLFEGLGGWIPVPAVRVRELGSGDCKGLATLLIAMLRAVGIDAHPVLVRTTHSGPLDPAAPNLLQFDHFIAWADDGAGGVFLDGTTDFFPAGRLPAADAGGPVLQLGPGEPKLVSVPESAWSPGLGVVAVTGGLEVSADGNPRLDLTLEYTATGNLGTLWRGYLAGHSRRDQEKTVLEILLPREPLMTGSEVEIRGMDEWTAPLVLKARAVTVAPLPKAPGRVFLPGALTALTVPIPDRPACGDSLDLRSLPARNFQWRLRLPPGYALAASDSSRGDAGGLSWQHRITQEGQEVFVDRTYRFVGPMVDREGAGALAAQIEKVRPGPAGYVEIRY